MPSGAREFGEARAAGEQVERARHRAGRPRPRRPARRGGATRGAAGPQQLFFPEVANRTLWFPTGIIPLFLVPYAIAIHTLSWLQLRRVPATGLVAARVARGAA